MTALVEMLHTSRDGVFHRFRRVSFLTPDRANPASESCWHPRRPPSVGNERVFLRPFQMTPNDTPDPCTSKGMVGILQENKKRKRPFRVRKVGQLKTRGSVIHGTALAQNKRNKRKANIFVFSLPTERTLTRTTKSH